MRRYTNTDARAFATTAVAALAIAQAVGCAAADSASEFDVLASAEESERSESAIYGVGAQTSFAAATIQLPGIGRCSATILNNHVIVTAAHCLHAPGGSSAGNILFQTTLNYDAPDGTTLGVTQDFFFYSHPNYTSGSADDIAIGATNTSLGLDEHHFAYLMRDTLSAGDDMVVAGSGVSTASAAATHRRLEVDVTSVVGRTVNWDSDAAWQGTCSGDSGAPYFMDSGEPTISGQPAFPILAGVHSGASRTGSLVGAGNPNNFCQNNGWGNIVSTSYDWIKDIVEFWPQNSFTCSSFTADSGDQVARCWVQQPSCEDQCEVSCAEQASASGNFEGIPGCVSFCSQSCD